jgi:hypothetical protein
MVSIILVLPIFLEVFDLKLIIYDFLIFLSYMMIRIIIHWYIYMVFVNLVNFKFGLLYDSLLSYISYLYHILSQE